MATPHVTGVGALVSSVQNIERGSYAEILEQSALAPGNPSETDNWSKYGAGLVQAHRALEVKWKRSA
jgi:hypothetical protein